MGTFLTKRQSLDLLKKSNSMPSVPHLLHTIFAASSNNNIKVSELSGIIEKDKSIVLMIIKSANSAYFNRNGTEITSLAKAITRIGVMEAIDIAMSLTLLHAMTSGINETEIKKFWVRSYLTAKTAVCIAKSKDPSQNVINHDDLYVMVILKEIGRVALASAVDMFYFDDEMCQKYGKDILALEEERYELNYFEAGNYILKLWNIPLSISRNISLLENNKLDNNITLQNISDEADIFVESHFNHIGTFDRAVVEAIPFLKKEFNT